MMRACVVPRTSECLACAFNGSLLTTSHGTVFASDGAPSVRLVNVYRNSPGPGGPCHVSVKTLEVAIDVDSFEVTSATFHRHLTSFPGEHRHEDPRAFPYGGEGSFALTCNDVIVSDRDAETIVSVRVRAYAAEDLATPLPTLPSPPESDLAPWEKNWMVLDLDAPAPRVVYALYPDLVVLDALGRERRRVRWSHPSDEAVHDRFLPTTPRFQWRRARWFRRARDLWDVATVKSTTSSFSIRGGAHPVLVRGRYWLFAHTRERDGRLYRPIVLALDPSTLDVVSFTAPISVPGFEDARIVYPMGAVYDASTEVWYVSCGLNDVDQILVRWPHADLTRRMMTRDLDG